MEKPGSVWLSPLQLEARDTGGFFFCDKVFCHLSVFWFSFPPKLPLIPIYGEMKVGGTEVSIGPDESCRRQNKTETTAGGFITAASVCVPSSFTSFPLYPPAPAPPPPPPPPPPPAPLCVWETRPGVCVCVCVCVCSDLVEYSVVSSSGSGPVFSCISALICFHIH